MASAANGISSAARQLVRTLYQEQHELFRHTAKVTGIGHGVFKGKTPSGEDFKERPLHWVTLNETIFHPQGGGQLSDEGTINGIPVDYVHKQKFSDNLDEIEVLHCFSENPSFEVDQTVELHINADRRHDNSLWHTAAHAVDYIITERILPHLVGVSGQCYPGSAFMKFGFKLNADPADKQCRTPTAEEVAKLKSEIPGIKASFAAHFEQILGLPLQVVRNGNGTRQLQIGDHPINCGGTHVHDLHELGQLTANKVSWEGKEGPGLLRVSFSITPTIHRA